MTACGGQLAEQLKLEHPDALVALNKHRLPLLTLDTTLSPGLHLAIPTKLAESRTDTNTHSRGKRARQPSMAEASVLKKVG